MKYGELYTHLKTFFETQWRTRFVNLPLVIENGPEEMRPDGTITPYGEFAVVPTDARENVIGRPHASGLEQRLFGIARVRYFYPKGRGSGGALDVMSQVSDIFDDAWTNGLDTTIHLRPTRVQQGAVAGESRIAMVIGRTNFYHQHVPS